MGAGYFLQIWNYTPSSAIRPAHYLTGGCIVKTRILILLVLLSIVMTGCSNPQKYFLLRNLLEIQSIYSEYDYGTDYNKAERKLAEEWTSTRTDKSIYRESFSAYIVTPEIAETMAYRVAQTEFYNESERASLRNSFRRQGWDSNLLLGVTIRGRYYNAYQSKEYQPPNHVTPTEEGGYINFILETSDGTIVRDYEISGFSITNDSHIASAYTDMLWAMQGKTNPNPDTSNYWESIFVITFNRESRKIFTNNTEWVKLWLIGPGGNKEFIEWKFKTE